MTNTFVRTLTIIHLALVTGVLIFVGIVMYLQNKPMRMAIDTNDTMLLIYPVIAIAGVFMSQTIFKRILSVAKQKTTLKEMLGSYQAASIIKYVLIEGPVMIGLVFYLLTGNGAFLAIAAFLIFYLIVQKPAQEKIKNELELKGELRKQFERNEVL